MKAVCIDDEPLAVEYTLKQSKQLSEISEAKGFINADEALEWICSHPTDIVLLDINMPGMDGITLAAKIKQHKPDTAVLFLTAYRDYAFDAFAVHPAGYLLKPISLEKLAAEVHHVSGKASDPPPAHIQIKTFGLFDVYVDGKPVSFKLSKAKEILAFLVDKQGFGIRRAELFAALWEDALYDRKRQKQLDVYIRSLRDALHEYGISEILKMEKGILRVDPDSFSCDTYLFYAGDNSAINAYRGEYMSSYSWASVTESFLYWKARRKTKNPAI